MRLRFKELGAATNIWNRTSRWEKTVQISTPLARYHQVLEIVANHVRGIGLNQLVEQSGLPRSSAYRLAASLCAVGYLQMNEAGLYQLGPKLMDLLKKRLSASATGLSIRPLLSELAAAVGETTFFAHLVDKRIDLVEVVTPNGGPRSYIYPGTGERPVDTCSSSKAILAYTETEVAKEVYETCDLGARRYDWKEFSRVLKQVKRDGFAVCDGEIDEGVVSLACPVSVGEIEGLFSIGIVGPSGRIKAMTIERLASTLRDKAQMASRLLTDQTIRKN